MSDRAKIIERIKKLFEVTTEHGASEAEAITAALTAQRLIAENNVLDWELAEGDEEPIESAKVKRTRKWQTYIALTVAENFRCKVYTSSGTGQVNLCFYGYASDAQAALITYKYLVNACAKLAAEYAHTRICSVIDAKPGTYRFNAVYKGIKKECWQMLIDTYAKSFAEGVASELEKQSVALMITIPPKVHAAYDAFSQDFAGTEMFTTRAASDKQTHEQAFAAGRDAIRAGRLSAANSDWLLGET